MTASLEPPPVTPRRVAILIAAYNAEATIERAIRSALAQPEVVEVCVIDDASADNTREAARASDPGDGRLVVLRQEQNAGPSAARNRGLNVISADWVGILDADDFLLPGRIGKMLDSAADADFVADEILRTPYPGDASAAQSKLGEKRAEAKEERLIDFTTFVSGNTGKHHGADLGFVKPLMRRSFLARHGMRYRTNMRLGEDYEFYARALALGARFKIVPAAGYVSVDREGSLSNKHEIADLRALRDCDDDLSNVRALTAEERAALRRHREGIDARLQWRIMIEAVKQRDVKQALGTFRSPTVSLFLAARLAEQAWIRGPQRWLRADGEA